MSFYTNHKLTQKANLLKAKDLYPFFRKIEQTNGQQVFLDGNSKIMIGSNNYLGLTHHPYVIGKSKEAIDKYGTGCTGSRFLNGNFSLHEELEERLAQFLGHERALVFATGMQTNLGALSAIGDPKSCLLFDGENHASIIDASRLAFGPTFKFKHNNMDSLEELLESNANRFERVIIVADGVFSMTGDILKLDQVHRLAKKYGAMVYVDDAHGLGVLGKNGRGTIDHFDLTQEVELNMGTFSKSFASIGGVISGKKELIDFIQIRARSFMFSAALPPSACATVLACIDILEKDTEEKIHQQLWKNVQMIKDGFADIGLYTYSSQTPIIPVHIGNDLKAMEITQYLFDNGIFATPVISPAVKPTEALIRTSYMATHTEDELSKVIEIFKKAKDKFDIPGDLIQ